jgi:hypothetical protein
MRRAIADDRTARLIEVEHGAKLKSTPCTRSSRAIVMPARKARPPRGRRIRPTRPSVRMVRSR